MNNSPKKNFYFTVGLLVVFSFGLIFVSKFFLGMVQNSYDELSDLYSSIENYQQAKQYLEKITVESVEAKEKKQEIDKNFIEKNKEVDFIVQLEKIAEETSNMIDISMGVLPKAKKGEDDEENALAFNVNLAGSFPNLLRFLDKMDTVKYFTDIITLNIQRIEKTVTLTDEGVMEQDNIIGNIKTTMLIKTYTK